ncbi:MULTISPECIES: P22 phage major capsid protein family protein [Streptomyces]
MAVNHTINTQEIVAKQALGLLESELILGAFVGKSAGADFAGATNDTVMVRRPSKLAARNIKFRAGESDGKGGVVAGDRSVKTDLLNESKMAVKLDQHIYSAIDLTDEQLTLNIDDFGGQVTAPQARAIAEDIEARLVTLINSKSAPFAPGNVTIPKAKEGEAQAEVTETIIRKSVLKARAKLNKDGIPQAGRILLVGANIEAALLTSAQLTQADMSGTTAGLRSAIIGQYFGFTVVVSQEDALIDSLVALHPSAFIFVSRAPMTPPSVKAGASVAANGAAVRSIRDYNSDTLSDRQVLSTFAGFARVTEPVFQKNAEGQYELVADATDPSGVKQEMKRALKFTIKAAA